MKYDFLASSTFRSDSFLTAAAVATPGVVEPAADVDVVVPERCSEDEEESTAPEAAAIVDDEAAESGLRRQ